MLRLDECEQGSGSIIKPMNICLRQASKSQPTRSGRARVTGGPAGIGCMVGGAGLYEFTSVKSGCSLTVTYGVDPLGINALPCSLTGSHL